MIDIISYFLIFLGLIMIITAIIGCNKLPNYFCKMHAATVGDVIGCPLILLGVAMHSNVSWKIILLGFVLLIVNPASSYMLNRFALAQEKKDAGN